MSVNPVLPSGVLPSYGLLPGANSRTSRPGSFSTAQPTAKVEYPAASDSASQLEQALRAGAAAASETSSSPPSQGSAGLALYKRVSQIGSDESTPSALLKRWNSIIQSGQDPDNTAAHNGATRFESGILDLTA
jgi:hypothetical protein